MQQSNSLYRPSPDADVAATSFVMHAYQAPAFSDVERVTAASGQINFQFGANVLYTDGLYNEPMSMAHEQHDRGIDVRYAIAGTLLCVMVVLFAANWLTDSPALLIAGILAGSSGCFFGAAAAERLRIERRR